MELSSGGSIPVNDANCSVLVWLASLSRLCRIKFVYVAREVPRPTAASARRPEHDSAAAVVGSDRALALNAEMKSWKVK